MRSSSSGETRDSEQLLNGKYDGQTHLLDREYIYSGSMSFLLR